MHVLAGETVQYKLRSRSKNALILTPKGTVLRTADTPSAISMVQRGGGSVILSRENSRQGQDFDKIGEP